MAQRWTESLGVNLFVQRRHAIPDPGVVTPERKAMEKISSAGALVISLSLRPQGFFGASGRLLDQSLWESNQGK